MPLFDDNQEDRTESPSQHRREEFRNKGTVALSREVVGVACLLAGAFAAFFAAKTSLKEFRELGKIFFDATTGQTLNRERLIELVRDVAVAWAYAVLPVFAVTTSIGILASVAQVGFVVSLEPLAPDLNRINPISGMQRLFSMQAVVDAVKTLFKVIIAGVILYVFVKKELLVLASYFFYQPAEAMAVGGSQALRVSIYLGLAMSVVAALDYGFQRFRLEKQLKMTRREAKEEFKLREGDPLIKSRIRAVQRKLASKRMMEDVPKADVVVTNPTHLAVALKYDPQSMVAPKVVAKGAGVIAQKIRELARENSVPLVENKPLARTLFKEIDVGGYIPKELYKAVAEVLSYVYRLRGITSLS